MHTCSQDVVRCSWDGASAKPSQTLVFRIVSCSLSVTATNKRVKKKSSSSCALRKILVSLSLACVVFSSSAYTTPSFIILSSWFTSNIY
jgi:hypothetical protein